MNSETWRSRITWCSYVEKTTRFLLIHWFWMSRWHMTTMDVQLCRPTDRLRTEFPAIDLLSLTVIWKLWSERKYSITFTFIPIRSDSRGVHDNLHDPIVFIPWTSRVTCTMTFCDCFSCILIMSLVLWSENCLESDQFCFLCTSLLTNLRGSVGLILTKV
jgi:hypothetical protein